MMSKPDGGPAFPCRTPMYQIEGDNIKLIGEGMTLRDYFAAKALEGLLAPITGIPILPNLAKLSYEIADAMLKEREKTS